MLAMLRRPLLPPSRLGAHVHYTLRPWPRSADGGDGQMNGYYLGDDRREGGCSTNTALASVGSTLPANNRSMYLLGGVSAKRRRNC